MIRSCKYLEKSILLFVILMLFGWVRSFADTNVSGTISVNTHWTVANSPYVVTGNLAIQGSAGVCTLTVDPGVVVKFDSQTYLSVFDVLIARGTAEDSVLFTTSSATPAPGQWGNIYFYPAGNGLFDHCITEYGGYKSPSDEVSSNILLRTGANVNFSNCTIRNSLGNGIEGQNCNSTIQNCRFVDNGLSGICWSGATARPKIQGNIFSANTKYAMSFSPELDIADVSGNLGSGSIEIHTGTLSRNSTWQGGSLPYTVSGNVIIYNETSSCTLTVAKGARIGFNSQTYLITQKGVLIARGTAEDSVVFTTSSAIPAPGQWGNIYFYPTGNGLFDHCIIEYGGYKDLSDFVSSNIYLQDRATVHISNSTIRKSSGNGIEGLNGNVTIQNCQFIDNGLSGIRWTGTTAQPIIQTNSFSGNTNFAMSFIPELDLTGVSGNSGDGAIEIQGGGVNRNSTWQGGSLPYTLSGSVTVYNGAGIVCTLTVAKGSRIRFNSATGLGASTDGVLIARGTAEDSVVFTTSSATPAPGQWGNIYIRGTGKGVFDHCVFEYGGYKIINSISTNIYLHDFATAEIGSCTIRKSAGSGLENEGNGDLYLAASRIEQNSSGIVNHSWMVTMFLRNNIITGNSHFGINNISGGNIDARFNYWGDPTGPIDNSDDRAAGGLYNPAGKGDSVSNGLMYSPWTWETDSRTVELTDSTPVQDTLRAGTVFYFAIHPQQGRTYIVELTPDSCLSSLTLSREYGSEIVATKSLRGRYELLVAASNDSVHHFMVNALQACLAGGSYSITLRYIDNSYLGDVSPRKAGNGGRITIGISGLNLSSALPVRLSGAGLPTYTAVSVSGSSDSRLDATLDLTGAQAGVYDVTVGANSPNTTIPGAFEILASATPGHLNVTLGGPSVIRRSGTYKYYINYENDGNADEPAPLLTLVSTGVGVRFSKSNPFSTNSFQFLAINTVGSAGILTPGVKNVLPFQASVLPGAPVGVSFVVKKMVADQTSMNWDSIGNAIRPDAGSMGNDAWNAIWSNFTSQVGSTSKDYLSTLNTAATYMKDNHRRTEKLLMGSTILDIPSIDQSTFDVSSLNEFEFARASGKHNPRQILASAEDVHIPAPGMPLTFSRIAPQPIPNRFRLGELGRGWYHSHEVTLTKDTGGRVLISRPGDSFARIFQPDGSGAYTGIPGEFAKLTITADTAVLQEKDGTIKKFLPDGKIFTIRDPNNNGLTFNYTTEMLDRIDHTNGTSLEIDHNGDGRISRVRGPGGIDIQYNYDGLGEHLVDVVKPGNVVTGYAYNPANGNGSDHAITTITNPDGTQYKYDYDAVGRLTEEADGDGSGRIRYQYVGPGVVRMVDNDNNATLMLFGTRGELLRTKDPNGNDHVLGFEGKDMVSEISRPDGLRTSVSYDGNGNPTGYSDPDENIVRTSYSSRFSQLTNIVDARSNPLSYEYDTLSNLNGITYADGKSEKFDHDAAGNVKKLTNRRGQDISYRVNAAGQVTEKEYPDGRTFTYTYDAIGNMLTAADSKTGTTTMQYDARKFLTRIEYPGGYWFSFEYDNAGNRTKRTDQLGNVLDYEYDAAGRLSRLVEGDTFEVVRYEYDANGRLSKEFKGNGTKTTYDYDAAGQILSMKNLAPDNSIQSRFDYTYDVNVNRTTMTTLDGTHKYTYDDIGQLIKVEYPGGKYESYEYDAAGNRIKVIKGGVTTAYTTNNLNQYTNVGSDVYTYDNDGNMLTKKDSTGTTTFEWDAESRLIKVTAGDGHVWEYTYDALGNRALVSDNGVEKRVVFDPRGLVDEAAEYAVSGKCIACYFVTGYGLLAKRDSICATSFYTYDAHGSTVAFSDSIGQVETTYNYGSFGGGMGNATFLNNGYGYMGRFGYLSTPVLVFSKLRAYSPGIGRFVSIDPLLLGGNDLCLYRFCENNPINRVDYLGNSSSQVGSFGDLIDVADAAFDKFDHVLTGTQHSRIANGLKYGGVIIDGVGWYKDYNQYLKDLESWSHGNLSNGDMFKSAGKMFYNSTAWWIPCNDFLWDATDGLVNWLISFVRSGDPNEKTATPGIGPEHYVPQGSELSYTIYFENKPTATAPAQEVFIHDNLSSNLDWSTFKLGEVAFGDKSADLIGCGQSGKYTVVYNDTEVVDIDAKINPSSGHVSWTLRSLDTRTGELPEDALAGFLPPEDGTGRGQGHVTYTVKAKSNLTAGTRITNTATIIFDTEIPITTNEVFNTITDSAPPAPVSPSPTDGTTDIPVSTVLNWSECNYATSYDIYLWPSGEAKPATPTGSDLHSTYYDASTSIERGKTYKWQVVAKNVMGSTPGPVWQFATVIAAPSITADPVNQSAVEGQTSTFTVVASGVNLHYLWQWNNADIVNANLASYTTPALNMANNSATFRCIVSNASGKDTSASATLTVTMAVPIVTADPSNQTVSEGAAATFTIAATGTSINYQWQKNYSDISGAISASYTTPAVAISDNGATFRCIVTNAGGKDTSASASLTVKMLSPVIITDPSNQTVAEGATATFTITATGTSISYQWQKNSVDISGAISASYTTPATVISDNGATFRCIVTNLGGRDTSASANLIVNMLSPVITVDPSNQTVAEGAAATFTTAATGTSISYQWQKNTLDISGAISASYTTPATVISDNGATFRCIVTNGGGKDTSASATLTVHKICAVSFTPGWNMVSFNVKPVDSTAASVFGALSGLTLVKDNSGKVFWPAYGINTIGTIHTGEAYKVYTDSLDTIFVAGHPIAISSTPISLAAGWNMVSYLPQSSMAVEVAFSVIAADITLVKNNQGQIYWPEYGINTIGVLVPGQGYKIHMKSEQALVYP